jgi:hypothetical protein
VRIKLNIIFSLLIIFISAVANAKPIDNIKIGKSLEIDSAKKVKIPEMCASYSQENVCDTINSSYLSKKDIVFSSLRYTTEIGDQYVILELFSNGKTTFYRVYPIQGIFYMDKILLDDIIGSDGHLDKNRINVYLGKLPESCREADEITVRLVQAYKLCRFQPKRD